MLLAITGIPSSASACVWPRSALLIKSGTNYCASAFADSNKTAMILLTTGTVQAACANVSRNTNARFISIGTTNTASASAKKNPRVLLVLSGMRAPANVIRAKSRATVQILLSGMQRSARAFVHSPPLVLMFLFPAHHLSSTKNAALASNAALTKRGIPLLAPADARRCQLTAHQAPFSTRSAANASSSPA